MTPEREALMRETWRKVRRSASRHFADGGYGWEAGVPSTLPREPGDPDDGCRVTMARFLFVHEVRSDNAKAFRVVCECVVLETGTYP